MNQSDPGSKVLLLLRHAKSSWDDDSLDDHDRPLNKRGRKAAPQMGRLLRDEALLPDLIVTSSAVRAHTTAQLVAKAAKWKGEMRTEPSLYLASPERYVRIVTGVEDAVRKLMLVGHNPGMEMLVGQLAGCEQRMPTAALAVIDLSMGSWSELSLDAPCSLRMVFRPKELVGTYRDTD